MPKKQSKHKSQTKYVDEISLRSSSKNPSCMIQEEELEEISAVGSGFYADVKVGIWTHPSNQHKVQVAIKCLKKTAIKDHHLEVLDEASKMSKLEHRHILKLYGICIGKERIIKLVTEYARYGCLLDAMNNPVRKYYFCQLTRLKHFANQVSHGMNYLVDKKLVHCDLAARNVLIVENDLVRISDFGLARALGNRQVITPGRALPVAWSAPEIIQENKYSDKSDVYSFGVFLWELMSFGEEPWEEVGLDKVLRFRITHPDTYLQQPKACSNPMYLLMKKCWSKNPQDRPRFDEISSALDKIEYKVGSATIDGIFQKPEMLSFEMNTKITLIERVDEQWMAQNEKADIGLTRDAFVDLNKKPPEKALATQISKPFNPVQISPPFNPELPVTAQVPQGNIEGCQRQDDARVDLFAFNGPYLDMSKPEYMSMKNLIPIEQMSDKRGIATDIEEHSINRFSEAMLLQPLENSPNLIDNITDRSVLRAENPFRDETLHGPRVQGQVPIDTQLHEHRIIDREQPMQLPKIPPRPDLGPQKESKTLPRPIPKPRRNLMSASFTSDEIIISPSSKPGSLIQFPTGGAESPALLNNMKDSLDQKQDSDGEGNSSFKPSDDLIDLFSDISDSKGTACIKTPSPLRNVKQSDEQQLNDTALQLGNMHHFCLPDEDTHERSSASPSSQLLQSVTDQYPEAEPIYEAIWQDNNPFANTRTRKGSPKPEHHEGMNSQLQQLLIQYDDGGDCTKNTEDPGKRYKVPHNLQVPAYIPYVDPNILNQPPPLKNPFTTGEDFTPRKQGAAGSFSSAQTFSAKQSQQLSPKTKLRAEEPQKASKSYPWDYVRLKRITSSQKEKIGSTHSGEKSEVQTENKPEIAYGQETDALIKILQDEFPELSKDECYARLLQYSNDIDVIRKILQVKCVTEVDEDCAKLHLKQFCWNVESAINYIIGNR